MLGTMAASTTNPSQKMRSLVASEVLSYLLVFLTLFHQFLSDRRGEDCWEGSNFFLSHSSLTRCNLVSLTSPTAKGWAGGGGGKKEKKGWKGINHSKKGN